MGLGSEIRDPEKTYPGSRGQKGTGSGSATLPCMLERIELFTEGQAFLRSYASVFHAPPLPSGKCLSFSVFLFFVGLAYWCVTGEGVGVELSHTYDRKSAWSLINRSILSDACQQNGNPVVFSRMLDLWFLSRGVDPDSGRQQWSKPKEMCLKEADWKTLWRSWKKYIAIFLGKKNQLSFHFTLVQFFISWSSNTGWQR